MLRKTFDQKFQFSQEEEAENAMENLRSKISILTGRGHGSLLDNDFCPPPLQIRAKNTMV